MKIVICGSMAFAQEMLDAQAYFEKKGYKVTLPNGVPEYIKDKLLVSRLKKTGMTEDAKRKIARDLIRRHYKEIKKGDAILVINKDRKGIKGYIGGNTFLEMGFAHVLNKKIFVMFKLPKAQESIYQELLAMKPIILGGDLELAK